MSQPEPLLSVRDLSVELGATRHRALAGLSLDVHAGERIALLGPSGCGKTTLLRAIAGFERPSAGSISLAGRVLSSATTHVPPHRRAIGLVFQDYALFPQLSLAGNVGFGLASRPPGERQRLTASVLASVGLTGLEARKPGELSGGQQQRVALARALAPEPALVLLDEPFSSLDSNLRLATRRHTERVLSSGSAASLLVTHDQAEAMSFAERLLVLRDGQLEQAGTPEQIYQAPCNAFVASFVGIANLLRGEAHGEHATTPLGRIRLSRPASGAVQLCLRPEALRLRAPDGAASARVVSREYQGPFTSYQVRGQGFDVTVHDTQGQRFEPEALVSLEACGVAAVLSE